MTELESGVILIAFVAVTLAILLILLMIVWKIHTDKIDLAHLVSEKTGQASLSRFQMLFFTFVVGTSYYIVLGYSLFSGGGGELKDIVSALNDLSKDPEVNKDILAALLKAAESRISSGISLPGIPSGLLVLIGISGTSYVVAKGIQGRKDQLQDKDAQAAHDETVRKEAREALKAEIKAKYGDEAPDLSSF